MITEYRKLLDLSERIKEIVEEDGAEDNLVDEGDLQQDLQNSGGKILEDITKYDDAMICYNKSLEIDPMYANAWERKGMIYHKLKKFDDAISCYDKVIEIDSKFENDSSKFSIFEMWSRKGKIFDDWEKPEESKECFAKATSLIEKKTW